MLIYVTILIILMLFSKQARGRSTCSLGATSCPRVSCWWPCCIHCIENSFTVHDIWGTCACPEKTELPWTFSLYWIYFLHSGFLTTCTYPECRVSLEMFHGTEYIFLSFRIFEQLCAWPEKQSVPWKFFLYWNIFYRSWFLSNLRLPWNTELPWNFSLHWMYILHSGVLINCACPEKQSRPGIFHCIGYVFLSNLRLPWKQSLPWKFSSPEGGGSPPTASLVRLCLHITVAVRAPLKA